MAEEAMIRRIMWQCGPNTLYPEGLYLLLVEKDQTRTVHVHRYTHVYLFFSHSDKDVVIKESLRINNMPDTLNMWIIGPFNTYRVMRAIDEYCDREYNINVLMQYLADYDMFPVSFRYMAKTYGLALSACLRNAISDDMICESAVYRVFTCDDLLTLIISYCSNYKLITVI